MPDKQLYHTTPSLEYSTVLEFLDDPNSPGFIYVNDRERFLNVIGEDGLTNRQRIEKSFKTPDEKRYIGLGVDKLPLNPTISLYLEYSVINNASSFITEGIEVVSTDDVAFKAAQLARLEADKGYVSVSKPIDGQSQFGTLKQNYPNITVWIWCRSLSNLTDGELSGELFDLTPFIQKCSINASKNGGNFQITLPPLTCEVDNRDKWVLKKQGFLKFLQQDNAQLESDGYLSEASLFDEKMERSKFLFHKLINANDLVFIRFETLKMESEQRYRDAYNYFIDKRNLPDRIYDMIGLVDSNTETITPGNNDVSINISGRDLSKLFLEDGTYFYAFESSQGILRLSGQSSQKNSLTSRIFSDGSLNFIGLYLNTSIEYIIKFVIQQLSNIKIVPDDLFAAYGKRRNTKFSEIGFGRQRDKGDTNYKPQFKSELASGIWQILKLVIDKSVINRRIQDSSFSTANGSLINFLKSACQNPLVEFYFDTYGDMFHLIIRKPPHDQQSVISLIEGKVNTEDTAQNTPAAIINIEEHDVLQESLAFNDEEVYSWYHFFPKSSFIGDSVDYSLSYLPAIYFPEYAEVFGSRAFQQCHNYAPYVKLKNGTEGIGIDERQAIEDLKYVIESSQYLPFTRKGTIVLNGDRRLKIGNVIRYIPTGEIFFIDGVNQSIQISETSIDRTTTIQVSRGMIEQLIYGVNLKNYKTEQDRFVSYFNIIDTRLVYNYIQREETNKEYKPIPQTNNSDDKANPGFGEYIQHQQGVRGAREIALAVKSGNNVVPNDIYFNMFGNPVKGTRGNVGFDYKGEKTPIGFYNYWLKKYNRAYNSANSNTSPFESVYQQVAKETGVPVDALRAFAKIESDNKNIDFVGTYQGLMQVSKEEAGTFGLSVTDPHDNVKTAALIYKRNTINNPFRDLVKIIDQGYDVIETKIKKSGIDRDGIFKNFKVNKYVFNFFLKQLQFDPKFKEVKSRVVVDNSGSEASGNVTVRAISKK